MEPEDLDPRELARTRRRDHGAAPEDRDLMRPGMGKVFKQILDHQGREAREAARSDAELRGDGSRPRRRKGR